MNDRKLALMGSILFHLILAVAAYLINYIILPPSVFKTIEIVEFGFNESANNERFISPLSQPSSYLDSHTSGRMSSLIPKKVKLPKIFSESDDEPVYIPKYEKTAFNALDMNKKIGNTSEKLKSKIEEKIFTENDVSSDDNPVISTNDDYLKSLTNRLHGESGSDSPYILEGEITNRSIVNRVIPKYPADLQRTVKVKIKFDVLKDGTVSNIIIIQKADSVLDKLSLDAIQRWKFNSIPQDIIQKGSITFIYELR